MKKIKQTAVSLAALSLLTGHAVADLRDATQSAQATPYLSQAGNTGQSGVVDYTDCTDTGCTVAASRLEAFFQQNKVPLAQSASGATLPNAVALSPQVAVPQDFMKYYQFVGTSADGKNQYLRERPTNNQ